MSDKQTETTNNHKLSQSLNERHRMVIDNLLDGMSKSKAYKTIYPNCKSVQSACTAVTRIMKNPEAIAYKETELQHREQYVNHKNQLQLDGIAQIYNDAISAAREIIKLGRNQEQPRVIADGAKTLLIAAKDYAQVFGKGAFDPAIKYKLETARMELLKAEPKIESNNNTIEALAKIIAD